MTARALAIAALVVACGRGSDAPVPTGSATGSATAVTTDAGSAAPVAAAVSPKVMAARCGEPCLFLVDTVLEDVPGAYKTACSKDIEGFGFDDCKALDYARNCIYAAHGKVYTKKKWKRRFATKSWYEPHPDFVETAFTAIEKANVHELYIRGKACKQGIHISTADRDRLKAWFAVLPKTPPTPPLVFGMQGEKLSGDAFVKQLFEQLDLEIKVNHKLDPGGATVIYTELDTDAADMDFVKPLRDALPVDHKSLRAVLADFALPGGGSEENPVSEGVFVLFVYDAKDRLVGLALDHYLLD